MRKALLSALAAATILSAGFAASRAAATTIDSALAATAPQTLTREASIVCGSNGCGVVQTKALKQKKLKWLGHG